MFGPIQSCSGPTAVAIFYSGDNPGIFDFEHGKHGEVNTREVEAIIREAFRNTPPPTGELTDTQYDDEGTSEYFLGRSWDGHDAPTLRMHEVAMSFFTPEAFRYYLPAYMLAELRDPENADILGEFVVYQFGEPEPDWKETYEKRLTLFTQDEKDAVLAFLRYMQERYGTFAEYVVFAEKQLGGNNGLNPA